MKVILGTVNRFSSVCLSSFSVVQIPLPNGCISCLNSTLLEARHVDKTYLYAKRTKVRESYKKDRSLKGMINQANHAEF